MPAETCFDDGLHHGRIIELLRIVNFVTAWNSASMIVRDVGRGRFNARLLVALNRADDIPLHDLHVVDVIEKFESLRADPLAQSQAPRSMVAHIILVVNLAVDEFHRNGYL